MCSGEGSGEGGGVGGGVGGGEGGGKGGGKGGGPGGGKGGVEAAGSVVVVAAHAAEAPPVDERCVEAGAVISTCAHVLDDIRQHAAHAPAGAAAASPRRSTLLDPYDHGVAIGLGSLSGAAGAMRKRNTGG